MGDFGFFMARRIWRLASVESGSVLCRSIFASGSLDRAVYSSFGIQTLSSSPDKFLGGSEFRSCMIQTLSSSPENFLAGSEFRSHMTGCGGFLFHPRRSFAASVSQEEQNKIVDEINSKFAEAREEIELAMESKETVYFNDEAESARAAVKVVLDAYDGLILRLDETERGALQRSMGLKMEQLKAELQQLND